MEILAPFQELNTYVKARFGSPVTLSCLGEKEIRVTYTQRILIKDVNINVDLHIDKVADDTIELTYKGALGLDMLIGSALGFFKKYFPALSRGLHPADNHRILIKLSEIEKAKEAVENIALTYINVENTGLRIGFSLKIPQIEISK